MQAHISLSWLLYGRLCIQFHVPLMEYIITKSSVPLFPLLMSYEFMIYDVWLMRHICCNWLCQTHAATHDMYSHRSMKLNTSGVLSHRHIETDVHYMMLHIMEVVTIVDQQSKCFVGWGFAVDVFELQQFISSFSSTFFFNWLLLVPCWTVYRKIRFSY